MKKNHPATRRTRSVPTIGAKLDGNKGVGPGFDLLRVLLAFCVVAFHVNVVLGNEPETMRYVWLTQYWVLAIFFSLSGFLIAGSALRLSLKNFLINRGLRILPALAVEILLSAFILGPIFTTLSLYDYFSSGGVYHYMTNIVGWINYELPGVFKDLNSVRVNTSLWTIPFEIFCYIIISACIILSLLKKPSLVVLAAILYCCVGLTIVTLDTFHIIDIASLGRLQKLYLVFCDRGSRLIVTFLLGIAAYLYRYRIPYKWPLFCGCIVYCLCIDFMSPTWLTSGSYPIFYPVLNIFLAVPLTYVMAFVGVTRIPTLPLFHRGDYSYGIYLYGFPIQQALFSIFHNENYWINLGMEIPVITIFAIFSWHIIEKPVLQLRKRFSFVAKVRLENPK